MTTTYEDILHLFQETDRRFQETERLIREQSQETDRKFQAADRKLNQLERLFTSQWGKLMESLVESDLLVEGDLVELLTQRGIPIADTATRLKGKHANGVPMEGILSSTLSPITEKKS